MINLKKIYQKTSLQTQNRLQEIFKSIDFDFNSLYSIANNKSKKRIDTYIEEWQDKGLLIGDLGTLARNIKSRNRVKNSEILELLIYGAYIEEQNKLKEPELNTFKEVANYYYQEGQKEVNKTLPKKKIVSVIPDAIFLALMSMPNSKGYIWNEYIETITKYNAEQIYRQATIDLQQQKELDITNDIYQNLIKRQQNSKLNINGDKISGDVDLTLIGINNQAKIKGIYSFDEKAKCKFISVEDEVTTKMCRSLNGQEFYIHDWNEFERYSKENDSIRKYKCYGLIVGLNLPPINDGFHWCRSTVIYQVATEENIPEMKTLIKKGLKIYTNKELRLIAKETNSIADKYTINKSKWSGKLIIDNKNAPGKLWSCNIRINNETAPHILLHEQLHAHSISYYNKDIYKQYADIEEATVQLFTQEISKKEGIPIISSAYDDNVNILKKINNKIHIGKDDFEFARILFEKPVNQRIDFLEDKIYDIMQTGNIQDYIELNNLLDSFRS